jgi:hypothetical protein
MLYGLAAPLAVIALPLAILLVLAGPRSRGARFAGGFAGGLGLWWLLGAGDLPDQVIRAAALMTAIAFAALSRRVSWSFTHRALAAIAFAAAGVIASFIAFGWSWGRLHWWAEFRIGPILRLAGVAAANRDGSAGLMQSPGGFEQTMELTTRFLADAFPAFIALQVLFGLVIAALLARRLVGEAAGVPPGPLAEFRFSEHLGWLLVLAIATLLFTGVAGSRAAPQALTVLGGARVLAVNLLVVIGTLYGLRGVAVILFGIRALKGGVFLYLAAALAVFFVLPGVVLLGVLDAGLNLRRRWLPPSGA